MVTQYTNLLFGQGKRMLDIFSGNTVVPDEPKVRFLLLFLLIHNIVHNIFPKLTVLKLQASSRGNITLDNTEKK